MESWPNINWSKTDVDYLNYLSLFNMILFNGTVGAVLQVFDKILAKKFDEQIVSLLLRMYEPTSEGSDISQFTKFVLLFF